LCDALRPIEYAVKMLCKESANLISAENAITFVNDELAKLDTPIANALKERFEERIIQRRNNVLVHLMMYLENPKFIDKKKDSLQVKIEKNKIVKLAVSLIQKLFMEEGDFEMTKEEGEIIIVEEKDSKAEVTDSKSLSLDEKFATFLKTKENFMSDSEPSIDHLEKIVKREMALFEASKSLPKNLSNLKKSLHSIKPTSVESERAFSAMNAFATKIRSRLNDDTMDAMIFLRQYYKNKAKNK